MPINLAVTRPVNPPGVTKITIEQLWAGIVKKAKDPKDFIPNIVSSSILEESGDKVVVEYVFRNGTKNNHEIYLHKPTSAIFYPKPASDEYNYITNLISFDKENNLLLTFSFAGGIPGQEQPSSVEEASQKVGFAIEKSIEKIREFVNEGLL